MSLERQILVWAAALAAIGYLLYLLGGVVTPFAAGIALGYLLDPVVRRLERFGLGRLAASLLILGVFLVVAALALLFAAPALGGQLASFAQRLPGYVTRLQALAVNEGNALIERYGGEWRASGGPSISAEQIQKSVGDFVGQGAQWLLNAVRSLASGGAAIFSFLSLLVITPVVAFYILVDWNKMVADHRRLAAARPSRHAARGRQGDRRGARRLHPRPVAGLLVRRPVVRAGPDADRPRLRFSRSA